MKRLDLIDGFRRVRIKIFCIKNRELINVRFAILALVLLLKIPHVYSAVPVYRSDSTAWFSYYFNNRKSPKRVNGSSSGTFINDDVFAPCETKIWIDYYHNATLESSKATIHGFKNNSSSQFDDAGVWGKYWHYTYLQGTNGVSLEDMTHLKIDRNYNVLYTEIDVISLKLKKHFRLYETSADNTVGKTDITRDFGTVNVGQVPTTTINIRSFLTTKNLTMKVLADDGDVTGSTSINQIFRINYLNNVSTGTVTITGTANVCGFPGGSKTTSSDQATSINTTNIPVVIEYHPNKSETRKAKLVFYDGSSVVGTVHLSGTAASLSFDNTYINSQSEPQQHPFPVGFSAATITAPDHYQVSANGTSNWGPSLSSHTGAFYVRFAPTAASSCAEDKKGNVTITSGSSTCYIAVSGKALKYSSTILWSVPQQDLTLSPGDRYPLNATWPEGKISVYTTSNSSIISVNTSDDGNHYIEAVGTKGQYATITASAAASAVYCEPETVSYTFTISPKTVQYIKWEQDLSNLKMVDKDTPLPVTLTAIACDKGDSVSNGQPIYYFYSTDGTSYDSLTSNVMTFSAKGTYYLKAKAQATGTSSSGYLSAEMVRVVTVRIAGESCPKISLSQPLINSGYKYFFNLQGLPGTMSGKLKWNNKGSANLHVRIESPAGKALYKNSDGWQWWGTGSDDISCDPAHSLDTISYIKVTDEQQDFANYKYIENLVVTQQTYFNKNGNNTKTIAFGEKTVGVISDSVTFTLTFANIPEIEIVQSGNTADFILKRTEVSSQNMVGGPAVNNIDCNCFGTATYSVKFRPTTHGNRSATYVFKAAIQGEAGGYKIFTLTVTGTGAKKSQTLKWNDSHLLFTTKNLNAFSGVFDLTDAAISYEGETPTGLVPKYSLSNVTPTGAVTLIDNNTKLQINTYGSFVLKANQSGENSDYEAAEELAHAAISISRVTPTLRWVSKPDDNTKIFQTVTIQAVTDDTEGTIGTISYSISTTSAGSVTDDQLTLTNRVVNTTIHATISETNIYAKRTIDHTFTPAKVTPTLTSSVKSLTRTAATNLNFSDLGVSISNATSLWHDVAIKYTSSNNDIANPKGSYYELLKSGSCTLTAEVVEGDNYNASTNKITISLTVNKATQSITWNAETFNPPLIVGDKNIQLNASASSGLNVSYTSKSSSIASVTTSGVMTCNAAGLVKVAANQSGNDTYDFAPEVSQVFVVNPTAFNCKVDDPKTAKSFIVSSEAASSGVTAATANNSKFEISSNGSDYSNSVNIAAGGTLYIRLKSTGTYAPSFSETITLTDKSNTSTKYSVTVSGKIDKLSSSITVPSSRVQFFATDLSEHQLVSSSYVYGTPSEINSSIVLTIDSGNDGFAKIVDGQKLQVIGSITSNKDLKLKAHFGGNNRCSAATDKYFYVRLKYIEPLNNDPAWQYANNKWYVLNLEDIYLGTSQYEIYGDVEDKSFSAYLPNKSCSNATFYLRCGAKADCGFSSHLYCDNSSSSSANVTDITSVNYADNHSSITNLPTTGKDVIFETSSSAYNESSWRCSTFGNIQSKYAKIEIEVPQHYHKLKNSESVSFGNVQVGEVAYKDIPINDLFKSFLTSTNGLKIAPASGPKDVFFVNPLDTVNAFVLVPGNNVVSPHNKLSANSGLVVDKNGDYSIRIYFKPKTTNKVSGKFTLSDTNLSLDISVDGTGNVSVKEPQTIIWDQDLSKLQASTGSGYVQLSATSSSGIDVTYSQPTNQSGGNFSVDANGKLTFSNVADVATCKVTANCGEGSNNGVDYATAESATREITVYKVTSVPAKCSYNLGATSWQKSGTLSSYNIAPDQASASGGNDSYNKSITIPFDYVISKLSFTIALTNCSTCTIKIYLDGTADGNIVGTYTSTQTNNYTIDFTALGKTVGKGSVFYCSFSGTRNGSVGTTWGYAITNFTLTPDPVWRATSTSTVDFGTQRIGQGGITKNIKAADFDQENGKIVASITGDDADCFTIVSTEKNPNPIVANCGAGAAAFNVRFIPVRTESLNKANDKLKADLVVYGPNGETKTIHLQGTAIKRDLKVKWNYADTVRNIDAVGSDNKLTLTVDENAFAYDKLRTDTAKTTCKINYTIDYSSDDIERLYPTDETKKAIIDTILDANGKIKSIQATGYGSGTVYIIASPEVTDNALFKEVTDADKYTLKVKVKKVKPTLVFSENSPTKKTFNDESTEIGVTAQLDGKEIKVDGSALYTNGTSGGPIALSSSDEDVVKITTNNTLNYVGAGKNIEIKATLQSDAIIDGPITNTFKIDVDKAEQKIEWSTEQIDVTTCNGEDITFDASALGDVSVGYSVALESSDCATDVSKVASIAKGTNVLKFADGYPAAVLKVTATAAESKNYTSASAERSIVITPCSTQTVTWTQDLSGLYYGDKITLTGASSLPSFPNSSYTYSSENTSIANTRTASADKTVYRLEAKGIGNVNITAKLTANSCYNTEMTSAANQATITTTDQKVFFSAGITTASKTLPAISSKTSYDFGTSDDDLPLPYAVDKRHSKTDGCLKKSTCLSLTDNERKTKASLTTPTISYDTEAKLPKYPGTDDHIAFIDDDGKLVVTGYGSGTVSLKVGAQAVTDKYNAVTVDADKATLTVNINKVEAAVDIKTDNTTTNDRYYGDVETISSIDAWLAGTTNVIKDYNKKEIYDQTDDFTLTSTKCNLESTEIQFNEIGDDVKVTAKLPADNLIEKDATKDKSFKVVKTQQAIVCTEANCSISVDASTTSQQINLSNYLFCIDTRHSSNTISSCSGVSTFLDKEEKYIEGTKYSDVVVAPTKLTFAIDASSSCGTAPSINGNTLTLNGTGGTIVVTATATDKKTDGTDSYYDATNVTKTFYIVVNRLTPDLYLKVGDTEHTLTDEDQSEEIHFGDEIALKGIAKVSSTTVAEGTSWSIESGSSLVNETASGFTAKGIGTVRVKVSQSEKCLVSATYNSHYTFKIKKTPSEIEWEKDISDYTTRNSGDVPSVTLEAAFVDKEHTTPPFTVDDIKYTVTITNKGCDEVDNKDIAYVDGDKLYVPGGTSAKVTIEASHTGKTKSGTAGYEVPTSVSKVFYITKVDPTIQAITTTPATVKYGDKVTLSSSSAVTDIYTSPQNATFTYSVDATYGDIQNINEFNAKKVSTAPIQVTQAVSCLTNEVNDTKNVTVGQTDQAVMVGYDDNYPVTVTTEGNCSIPAQTARTAAAKAVVLLDNYFYAYDVRHSTASGCDNVATWLTNKTANGLYKSATLASTDFTLEQVYDDASCNTKTIASLGDTTIGGATYPCVRLVGEASGLVRVKVPAGKCGSTNYNAFAADSKYLDFRVEKVSPDINLIVEGTPTTAVATSTAEVTVDIHYGDVVSLGGSSSTTGYSSAKDDDAQFSISGINASICQQSGEDYEAIAKGTTDVTVTQSANCRVNATSNPYYNINVIEAPRTVYWSDNCGDDVMTNSGGVTLGAYTKFKNNKGTEKDIAKADEGTLQYSIVGDGDDYVTITNGVMTIKEIDKSKLPLPTLGVEITIKASFENAGNFEDANGEWTFMLKSADIDLYNITGDSITINDFTSTTKDYELLPYLMTEGTVYTNTYGIVKTNYPADKVTYTLSSLQTQSDIAKVDSDYKLTAYRRTNSTTKEAFNVIVTAKESVTGSEKVCTLLIKISRGTLTFSNNEQGGKWKDYTCWSRQDIAQKYITENACNFSEYNVLIKDYCHIGKESGIAKDETEFLAHRFDVSCYDLKINDSGKAKLVIGEASTLNVNGDLINGNKDRLYITSNMFGQATLVFNGGTPKATLEMYVPAGNGKKSDPVWQYRGICVSGSDFAARGETWKYVAVYRWNEAMNNNLDQGCWELITTGGMDSSAFNLTPWTGYAFANLSKDTMWLQYSGTLINSPQNLSLSYNRNKKEGGTDKDTFANVGMNLITNSYTVPLRIKELQYPAKCEKGIVLYNAGSHTAWTTGGEAGNQRGSAGQHSTVPQNTGGETQNILYIPAGQSFFVKAVAKEQTLGIRYGSTYYYVAPSDRLYMPREEVDEPEFNILTIKVRAKSDSLSDEIYLVECEGCTRQYDNGYDGKKVVGKAGLPQLYAYNKYGITSVNADSTMNKQYIGFQAGNDDETYMISFETDKLSGYHSLYLVDRKLNESVDILAGETYSFKGYTVGENMRFQINGVTEEEWQNQEHSEEKDDESGCDLKVVGKTLYVEGYSGDASVIEVFDMTGNLVWSTALTAVRVYDLPEMPQGVYMIRVGECSVKYSTLK